MPAVRRLVERRAARRERSEGRLYSRLINGERGGYLGYAMWRRYLTLAHGYTASHEDGLVNYTAHERRHVCASLLKMSGVASSASFGSFGERALPAVQRAALEQARSHGSSCTLRDLGCHHPLAASRTMMQPVRLQRIPE